VTGTNRVNSGDLEIEVWADQVTIRCRGWGHGVGMCQWCAKGMADEQQDWRSMMKVFYPGAEAERI
jgi:stage II sporulation protein D